jgi:hypothetical protein
MSIPSFDDLRNQTSALLEEANPDAPPEDAPPEDAPPGPAAPWNYGPPAMAPRESNFISDESLLLWLAQKQDGLYGDLRDHMDMSRERSKLILDLSHLKENIDSGQSPEQIREQVEQILQSYGDTPYADDLEKLFQSFFGAFEIDAELRMPVISMADKETADLSAAIQSTVDSLGRDDQLELIQIQSLTADIREAGQLASNLLSSSNQTANAIVGNIAR